MYSIKIDKSLFPYHPFYKEIGDPSEFSYITKSIERPEDEINSVLFIKDINGRGELWKALQDHNRFILDISPVKLTMDNPIIFSSYKTFSGKEPFSMYLEYGCFVVEGLVCGVDGKNCGIKLLKARRDRFGGYDTLYEYDF